MPYCPDQFEALGSNRSCVDCPTTLGPVDTCALEKEQ